MPTYAYSALNSGGRRRRGLIQADDPRTARRNLAEKGLWAEQVSALSSKPGARRSGLRNRSRRALVYRELSALLRAGLTLERGLAMMGEMPEMTACRNDLAAAVDLIREGAGPSVAWAQTMPIEPLESAALAAGERSGTLEITFDRLATLLEIRVQARNRLVSAMIYPALVGVLAIAVAIGMLGFMLPSFMRVWTDAGIVLPRITRMVSTLGRWGIVLLVPLTLAAAGLAVFPRVRRRLYGPLYGWARRGVEKFELLGRPSRAWAASQFSRTLALLLRGGVPVVEALPLAGRATGRKEIAEAVERLSGEVRQGLPLASALRRTPVLAESLGPWVEAGEASGDLDGMMERAADREQDIWERGLERAVRLVEPALILLLGGFVFLIALAILMPILSLPGAK